MVGCVGGYTNLFVKVGAGSKVTKLKALSSVSFVPALRDKLKAVKKTQGCAASVAGKPAVRQGSGNRPQGPAGRWQCAAESSEGGRVRCRFGRSFGFELDEAAEEGGGSGGDAGGGAG